MDALPAPLVPAEVDLTNLPYMPILIARLKQSRAWLLCKRKPELAFYLVNLWTAAWHARPASSLESDDDVLADLAMCQPQVWKKVRGDVLRGWVECADGRLYHPVVAEQALVAWGKKTAHRDKMEAERYGWRSAIFSPEMPVVPQYRDKIRRIRLRRPPLGGEDAARADAFIDRHFRFIDASVEDLNEEATLPWVVDRAEDLMQRDGIDALVIDPWNEVEHSRGAHESAPDYIGRSIRMLKRFAKERQVVGIVVAHPTKEVGREGKGRMPTPYDIQGSAHWYNKLDHVVVVHRPDEEVNQTLIRVAKVRFEETGTKGHVSMAFNRDASRYELLTYRGEP